MFQDHSVVELSQAFLGRARFSMAVSEGVAAIDSWKMPGEKMMGACGNGKIRLVRNLDAYWRVTCLAEFVGYVNRAPPDHQLDGFAKRISSPDKQTIAETKRMVNVASLPSDAEIEPE